MKEFSTIDAFKLCKKMSELIYPALVIGDQERIEEFEQLSQLDLSSLKKLTKDELLLIKRANENIQKDLLKLEKRINQKTNMIQKALQITEFFVDSDVMEDLEEKLEPDVPPAEENTDFVKEVEAFPPIPESSEVTEKKSASDFQYTPYASPLPKKDICDYKINIQEVWKLDNCAKLFEQMTLHKTDATALVKALTTFDFRNFCGYFRSRNRFFVWLNVILRAEILSNRRVWLKRFLRNTQITVKQCGDTLRKCMDVNVLKCCLDIGVELNIYQRDKAVKRRLGWMGD